MNRPKIPITDSKTIKSLIPHREPMIMVDGVLAYTKLSLTGTLSIHANNILVENNQLTEAGLLEHMAQCAALHRGYRAFLDRDEPQLGFIGALKKVSINKLPQQGEKLISTVEILNEILGITLVKAVCKCNGDVIATCEMTTALAHED